MKALLEGGIVRKIGKTKLQKWEINHLREAKGLPRVVLTLEKQRIGDERNHSATCTPPSVALGNYR